MSKPHAILSPLDHRGAKHIKVEIANNDESKSLVRQVPGRKWSRTHRCWYVPYSSEAFQKLKELFEIKVEDIVNESEMPIQKNADDSVGPSTPKHLIEPKFIEYVKDGKTMRKIIGEKIIVKKNGAEWIAAFVPYDKTGWVNAVREINGRKWDAEKTCWLLPYVKTSFYHLKKSIGLKNIVFDFTIQKDIPNTYNLPVVHNQPKKKNRPGNYDQLNDLQKTAIKQTGQLLILKQYSYSTLKVYKAHLAALFNFHRDVAPQYLESSHVQQFLLHSIRFKKITESTQNQIINAYKAYVEKVLKRPKEWVDIPRPKKPKNLPNVLSEEEVVKLIRTPKNIKHKLILLLIYSAGLRLGEVVNIRTRDINYGRRTIFIRRAKGKKDRFVTLADAVIPYLKKYKKEKNPIYWLFEGQYGGQYSKRSVQRVFISALEKSKVNAYATVHTLRHSYATHCVENGFSLALIQGALGHASLKTTEKYLHISSKALAKLKSPLDILADKKNK